MNYQKYFDYATGKPQKKVPLPKLETRTARKSTGDTAPQAGDRRDGLVYVYDEKIELAVNVALATGRPMLIRGPSGSGKSSLARNVARRMMWSYYEKVITSRTQARDLQWNFDNLRRLSDAQAKTLRKYNTDYIEPGVLWWAFDPQSATRRGQPGTTRVEFPATDPGLVPDNNSGDGGGAVVLLDEIDKADPDVPNNLLVPLGSLQFKVTEMGAETEVRAARPVLVLITTNDERVLPNAFLRRCVVLELAPPDAALLVKIAVEHFGSDKLNIYQTIAERIVEMAPKTTAAGAVWQSATTGGGQAAPSTAEYLDTVRACLRLGIKPDNDDAAWRAVVNATLLKRAGST